MMTPLVRLISSRARKTSGFCCKAVTTACSSVKTGAPLSDTPISLGPSAAARNPIGVAEGDGETLGEGTDAVPTSLGVPDGAGVGVDVETSNGVSVGPGVCPIATSAMKKELKAKPAVRESFRITG